MSELNDRMDGLDPLLNLHALLPRSRANGPGLRFAIWFQGCDLACPGCFNPGTHPFRAQLVMRAGDLVRRCAAEPGLEGVTVSGGEPLRQPQALRAFLRGLKERTSLSVVLFSGYDRAEIQAFPEGPAILSLVDVLVAGRYDRTQPCQEGLRTSRNQRVHRLTERYAESDLNAAPALEVVIDAKGGVTVTGVMAGATGLESWSARDTFVA